MGNSRFIAAVVLLLVALGQGLPARAADVPDPAAMPDPALDRGYHLLYALDFPGAQQVFADYEKQHLDDPLGPVSEAAGLLFSELNRLGVLESQFYVKDSAWSNRPKLNPDPQIKTRFDQALDRADALSNARLSKNASDHDGLFAHTLALGLRADYAALVEKRNLASLQYTRDSKASAEKLLALHPSCYDAYLATGISDYVIGNMSAPVRWLLHVGGYSGDKHRGIASLEVTAEKGHYLAPFARLLLAIAYLRDKDVNHAKDLLRGLQQEFPSNQLFTRELARLDQGR